MPLSPSLRSDDFAGIFVISSDLDCPVPLKELLKESQCPSGHFCYFFMLDLKAPQSPFTVTGSSQCPSGHFCYFFELHLRIRWCPPVRSQCPSGHFCYFFTPPFPPSRMKSGIYVSMPLSPSLRFEDCAGIFVISSIYRAGLQPRTDTSRVSMPLRHFCFSFLSAKCHRITLCADHSTQCRRQHNFILPPSSLILQVPLRAFFVISSWMS
jgi:hypothetical protein